MFNKKQLLVFLFCCEVFACGFSLVIGFALGYTNKISLLIAQVPIAMIVLISLAVWFIKKLK